MVGFGIAESEPSKAETLTRGFRWMKRGVESMRLLLYRLSWGDQRIADATRTYPNSVYYWRRSRGYPQTTPESIRHKA